MANITAPIMLDSTGQDIADAISTIGATSVGNLNALTTTDKTSLVGAVNEVKRGLTNYAKVQAAYLHNETVISSGNFELVFEIPTVVGYRPIGAMMYNLADRGIAENVHVSGVDIVEDGWSTSTVRMYGSVSQSVTFKTGAYVNVLFIRV